MFRKMTTGLYRYLSKFVKISIAMPGDSRKRLIDLILVLSPFSQASQILRVVTEVANVKDEKKWDRCERDLILIPLTVN